MGADGACGARVLSLGGVWQVMTLRSEAESLWQKSRKRRRDGAPRRAPSSKHRKNAAASTAKGQPSNDRAAHRTAQDESPGLASLGALWEQHARAVFARDPAGGRAGCGGAAGMHLVGALALVARAAAPSLVGLQGTVLAETPQTLVLSAAGRRRVHARPPPPPRRTPARRAAASVLRRAGRSGCPSGGRFSTSPWGGAASSRCAGTRASGASRDARREAGRAAPVDDKAKSAAVCLAGHASPRARPSLQKCASPQPPRPRSRWGGRRARGRGGSRGAGRLSSSWSGPG